MLQSKNGLLRVRQIVKMRKIFEHTKEDRLEKVDKNLIKGMFRRRTSMKQAEIEKTKQTHTHITM
jgi:hypothetical protein